MSMRLSIITINYNDQEGLLKTVRSVVGQSVQPYEFIVIDGGSTDGSREVIEEFKSAFSYWVSEKDKGIYNAMNKGIDRASGEWCLFLNAGDILHYNNVLSSLDKADIHTDIVCGNVWVLTEQPYLKKAPDSISMDYLYGNTICHQSALIRTEILKKHHYDESLRIVSDRKLFLQALILDNASYQHVDVDLADYDVNGFSSKNRFLSEQEYRGVLEDMLPARILADYGKRSEGALFGVTPYEKMFLEIGKRKYRRPVYRIVRSLMVVISWFKPGASFVKAFPKKP